MTTATEDHDGAKAMPAVGTRLDQQVGRLVDEATTLQLLPYKYA